jgi:hypothetical protein
MKSTCMEVMNVIVERDIPMPRPMMKLYPSWTLVLTPLSGRIDRRPHPRSMRALARFNVR